MKIRIVRASKPMYWYADKIGEKFDVLSYRKSGGFQTEYGVVDVRDAVVVTENLSEMSDEELDRRIHEILAEMKKRRFERLKAEMQGGEHY